MNKLKKYFAQGDWANRYLSQWITTIVIMINIGLALAILAGGLKRFSLPSYQPLIDYSQGHIWVWGAIIAISAFLMATPFRWLNILGLWTGMSWHIVWMACFTIANIHYETAAATPIPMYGGLAMLQAALLTARVIDKTGG